MELLQLFTVEPKAVAKSSPDGRLHPARDADEARWHEAELFLTDRLERDGDIAQIQVALALCEASGGRTRTTLEELAIDHYRFPRAAHAIARVIKLLDLPLAERPEGFWPRFLLDQLEEPNRA